mgnify:CR=1 FL=1
MSAPCIPMKYSNHKYSFYWGQVTPHKISKGRVISNDIYYLYSIKLQRLITLESRLEYYNWLLIEIDQDITSACEQFPRLAKKNGEYYTMDAWIKNKNGEEAIIEVKESKHLIEYDGVTLPKRLHKFYGLIEKQGVSLKVITEKSLRNQSTLIQNWIEIYPFLITLSKNTLLIKRILSLCSAIYDKSLEEFLFELKSDYSTQEIISHIFLLALEGKVQTDLQSAQLSNRTQISV